MATHSEHWDQIYHSTPDTKLGWHENDYDQTLKFVSTLNLENKRVFIAGAGNSMLASELLERGAQLILNDLSETALSQLSEKLTKQNKDYARKCEFLVQSISSPLPTSLAPVDLWIDRAVLHFLTQDYEIEQYFKNVKALVKRRGYVLLAEFAIHGADKCAGLPVHRYSIELLQERLGSSFNCLAHETYTYQNPAGQPRPYVYGWFQRKNSLITEY
ncbi:MAG: putative short-chain dehydrogenase [Idiomarinaceae bacterium HL-53]|nr:MAG: putative short-chain dehydrogenase [Idiomarinaceae bacterium HL-53]CUS49176.1 Methyltransferase domain-containing protein [Idiomarinaceae bacterium HL-53]